jgi:hypothetical protein
MDERFVYALEHTAQSMNEAEFMASPKLAQAAYEIRDPLRAKYDAGPPAQMRIRSFGRTHAGRQ